MNDPTFHGVGCLTAVCVLLFLIAVIFTLWAFFGTMPVRVSVEGLLST